MRVSFHFSPFPLSGSLFFRARASVCVCVLFGLPVVCASLAAEEFLKREVVAVRLRAEMRAISASLSVTFLLVSGSEISAMCLFFPLPCARKGLVVLWFWGADRQTDWLTD